MWPVEPIPDECHVFRQVHFIHLVKDEKWKKRRFPNETHFTPDDDGLSVNWDKYCSENTVLLIIGLSRKRNGEYKNPRDFKVFKFNVGNLRNIDGIEEVKHDPIFNGLPFPDGAPNNQAHSLVIYPNDEEIRLKLSDHVRNDYDNCFCPVNLNLIDTKTEELKKRLSNGESFSIDRDLL